MVHGEERKEGEGKLGDMVVYPGAAGRHAKKKKEAAVTFFLRPLRLTG